MRPSKAILPLYLDSMQVLPNPTTYNQAVQSNAHQIVCKQKRRPAGWLYEPRARTLAPPPLDIAEAAR